MLWGRLTWGVFWRWDARLTTTAFLFVTYIGYLAVRRLGGTPDQRARRSGVLALLAVLEIPLVHFSVELWRGLHQDATVLRPDGDVELDGLMLFTLLLGIVAFTVLYAWLVIHRQRAADRRGPARRGRPRPGDRRAPAGGAGLMEDAGFILTAYAVTFGAVIAYAAYVIRRGRRATADLPDEVKPWL